MIRTDQHRRARNLILDVVSERKRRAATNHALVAQNAQIRVKRQLAQRHHALQILQQRQFALQILPASRNSSGVGLLSGGAQRTAAVMYASGQRQPIAARLHSPVATQTRSHKAPGTENRRSGRP